MNRIEFLQFLIHKYKYDTYLEIGTQRGNSLLPLKCRKKIAVDPEFKINLFNKIRWYLLNPYNFSNRYFEMTSDLFFKRKKKYLRSSGGVDLVFVDGLHTYQAALKDCLNSLRYLTQGGTIVVHDSFPPHKAASVKASNSDEAEILGRTVEGWNGEWCGDVWKSIAYLKKRYANELDVFVLDFDFGLGIIKKKNAQELDLNIDNNHFKEISKFKYEDLVENSKGLIDLREKIKYKEV